ncbi:hypothetical protein PHLGIDRAFT_104844 [Phlebiopsis gigantea 11061_1 CR5-6]|uniref:Ribosomal protein S12 n=1 Tax=Phlebiopsis gigantea (strain 11061_1 CR5-6) TaxID=745531 RepID=A0A0C3NSA7_PHLG1|nr:hypothetical protein PHLGIDRAFT_104844 [Phlebiopsis gigantea 11061_1 CR5-6]
MFSALRAFASIQRPWAATSASLRVPTLSSLLAPSISISRFGPLLRSFHASPLSLATLNQSTRRKHKRRAKVPTSPLLHTRPQVKGVVSSVFIAKPKKPNSAKRKVARVKLSNGEVVQAYIPGEGHNLQEHSVVLVRGGRAQDLPGVRYKCVRGKLDLNGVVGRLKARSKYGAKMPKKQ